MCGIAGTFGKQSPELSSMLVAMAHRGPNGTTVQALPNAALGHARLAIVDIEGGNQPISNKAASCWLVCNGEIYNSADLRARCPTYLYQTDSDNEVILALYERYGPACVRYLDGMFAFALIEQTQDSSNLLLARDPLGIKPLYYGWQEDALYFASEIKALHGKLSEIREFPPGYFYTHSMGFVPYYEMKGVRRHVLAHLESSVVTNQIVTTLERAVSKRLMSDVPVGVLLSGGLDSSIVAALAARQRPHMHSFAVGLEGSRSADLHYSRQVADYLGMQHHQYVYSRSEMIDALPQIIYHLESFDPLLVRSAIPNYVRVGHKSEQVKDWFDLTQWTIIDEIEQDNQIPGI